MQIQLVRVLELLLPHAAELACWWWLLALGASEALPRRRGVVRGVALHRLWHGHVLAKLWNPFHQLHQQAWIGRYREISEVVEPELLVE